MVRKDGTLMIKVSKKPNDKTTPEPSSYTKDDHESQYINYSNSSHHSKKKHKPNHRNYVVTLPSQAQSQSQAAQNRKPYIGSHLCATLVNAITHLTPLVANA